MYTKLPLYSLPTGFSPSSKKEKISESNHQKEEVERIKFTKKNNKENLHKKYKKLKSHKNSKKQNTKKKNPVANNIPIFSANGAGVINKVQSLVNNVTNIGAGIITLQETHFRRKGRLNDKLPDFEIFEAIRKKQKGGTLIAVHKGLDPVLIEEFSEDFELLVVEVSMGDKEVRIISGYGPQENWRVDEKMPFFRALEGEIVNAKLHGKAIYIQMDANSKLGPEIIRGDPHSQTENGKLLTAIIKRHALIVMNNSEKKCTGRITRRRITSKSREESIIDFVIVCDNMEEIISDVRIDEERTFVLTSYRKTKNGTKVIESDHHSIITNIKSTWNMKLNTKRTEIYNFKDKDSLRKFKEMTSRDKFLSEVFNNNYQTVTVKTKKLMKRLKFCLSQCFRKVRLKQTKKNKEIEELFRKRTILRTKKDHSSQKALEAVEEKLSDMCAEENLKIIKEACGKLSCETGGLNVGNLWQLKKKLRGRCNEPPTAMNDEHGNLVTGAKALEELTIKTYIDRLKALNIKKGLEVHQMKREELCEKRLEEAHSNVTPDWDMKDLERVLKQLKTKKSCDPLGFSNELFKLENAGEDLKAATLKLMNEIKSKQEFPDILKICNITSLYKSKGSRKEYKNYRGIFRVTVLRSILDKLIYNDEYPKIDENLTDSNVGAH